MELAGWRSWTKPVLRLLRASPIERAHNAACRLSLGDRV